MDRSTYKAIEDYMLACMQDSAHDKEHVYRVLWGAITIADNEGDVDYDILIAAALLHDIGRSDQFKDPSVCHAEAGSQKALRFLLELGWKEQRAAWVRDCILTHRFRTDRQPASLEARILFDADKLDVTGAIGIARTLFYGGQISQPLYLLDEDGTVLTAPTSPPSFFREYNYKLRHICQSLYTEKAKSLAAQRQAAADGFYDALLSEVSACSVLGPQLDRFLTPSIYDCDSTK